MDWPGGDGRIPTAGIAIRSDAPGDDLSRANHRPSTSQGLVVLEPAEAQNKDTLVVTPETAEQYGLTSIADMAEVCDRLVIAVTPEFAERAYGLSGLEEDYGSVPASFESINDGEPPDPPGPARRGRGRRRHLQHHPVDRRQRPGGPRGSREQLHRPAGGPPDRRGRRPQAAVDARNEHSGKLSTEDLAELDRRVSGEEQVNAADAAEEWLSANGCWDRRRPGREPRPRRRRESTSRRRRGLPAPCPGPGIGPPAVGDARSTAGPARTPETR
ncbi:UNVERIFIED_CONTAM: glycine betaine ABC transporter substrate-binding protein [Kocuria sp. CPCC 205300]